MEYKVVADELRSNANSTAPVLADLVAGKTVFIPGLIQGQVHSRFGARKAIRDSGRKLTSRRTEIDGIAGVLIWLVDR